MRMRRQRSEVGQSQSLRRIRKSPSDPALLLPRVLLTVGLLLALPRRIDSIHCSISNLNALTSFLQAL